MPTVTYEGRLIAHRLEIHIIPRASHISELLVTAQYRRKSLSHLKYVEETHCNQANIISILLDLFERFTHRRGVQIVRPIQLSVPRT